MILLVYTEIIDWCIDTHVLGEVSGLIALATFNALSRTRLGAVLGSMALLLAVLASEGVDPFLGAVTSSVTNLMTIYALDLGFGLSFDLLLLAMLPEVSTDYHDTTGD